MTRSFFNISSVGASSAILTVATTWFISLSLSVVMRLQPENTESPITKDSVPTAKVFKNFFI